MKKLGILIVLLLIAFSQNFAFAAPSVTNRIGLRIARVYLAKEDAFEVPAEAGTNTYEYFNKPLKNDDQIRYGWFGTLLNTANVGNPQVGNGYLKIYKNDDASEANFIKNYGTSPLPVREIAEKLTPGRNTILLVLVENANGTSEPATKVQLSFNYEPETIPPSIEVISPSQKSVFASGVTHDFSLKINNFFIEKENTNQPNKGMLEVYLNTVTPDTKLFATTNGINRDTYSEISFTTADIEKIQDAQDNKDAQLVFVLKTSAGKEIEVARKALPIVTNYGGTLDLGLPSVKIVTPKNNAEIGISTPIELEVKNFDLLASMDVASQKPNAGYVQIRIDDKVVVNQTNKTTFTLADFGLTNYKNVINLKVDLVNQQFALLRPSANASVSVVIKQDTQQANTSAKVTNNTWRYILLAATILLILGSITVLIIKG